MTPSRLLSINPGSSSLKLGVFDALDDGPVARARAQVDLREQPPRLTIRIDGSEHTEPLSHGAQDDAALLVRDTLDAIDRHLPLSQLAAVGHRVVHGGRHLDAPALIDDAVLAQIEALVSLAPLHQPHSVRLIRAFRDHAPTLRQVACFDTAFHAGQPAAQRRLPLPRELHDAGIQRYGFHGLSYTYIVQQLRQHEPALAQGRVVAAHLGSGASLCALHDGASVDCTMGFSTLDGIPMATRSGTLDPGVLLHLLRERGMSLEDLDDLLHHRCGLLGLSGSSADIRTLLACDDPDARLACTIFAQRIAREIAALATTLGGLDAIVFTAGIGEHQPWVRSAVCAHLAWLGVRLDATANARHARRLDTADSRIAVCVIPTDEEAVIAQQTAELSRVPARP